MIEVTDATSPAAAKAPVGRGVVVVTARRRVADDVVELTLARPDGTRLPDWAPGAHIDLILPDGLVRQYSLCGDRWDAATYRIAVQRDAEGRGGSVAVHDAVRPGDALGFGGPRNNFRLAPATDLLFVSGGIGITPILPMIRQAELLDIPWRLLYLGRGRTRLAYLDELSRYGDRVTVHCGGELGRADLAGWRPRDPRTRVYSCGPARLLDAVEAWGAVPGGHAPRIERFSGIVSEGAAASRFEVVAARTGVATRVEPHESVAEALTRAGVRVVTSCGQGVCGTCETDVVDGVPDHRDALLDDEERRAGRCMFPCVSRSSSARLVLDI
ncbi:PDR/VanB family oxidoreductase [Microbacterium sp. SORGH_AS_0888]|uniref:PDR/VanB family oxidoreductase n=1 Tax=Microbacterium sp. SORGH_AS_0888 TaxID=3041791 RepID=UPI00277E4D2D|nr:PDR/VanB family oxidoreductase [Microbacterium sp. SORGH_AS_0888]MDQ1129746.1 ferredoxin-NADP reductase [Microbacterium sp. SORGH_AS_0888]